MLFVNVHFISFYNPSNAFVLGDVHIPVSCKFSTELVISPPEFGIFDTAMYKVGPIRPSVTGP